MNKALVVLSGGQDSTTCLFWALKNFKEVEAITFDYKQRHRIEIDAARKVAEIAGVKHTVVEIPPEMLRSMSPLTNPDCDLEEYENAEIMDKIIGDRIEKTFVPMRNMLFLTIAANHALASDCGIIVTGICQADNANYPDCTEHFRAVMTHAINVSLGKQVLAVVAPLMNQSKAQTCKLARDLGPLAWKALAYSHTSYDGLYPPTGRNHSNVLRADGFEKAGLPDPLVLRAFSEGLMELPDTPNYKGLTMEEHGFPGL